VLASVAVGVLAVLAVVGRQLWFASVDPDGAEARGVPVRTLSIAFPMLLAVVVAQTIQVTGVLLILTLVITPAAAAQLLVSRPMLVFATSIGICLVATVGGIVLALTNTWPVSFYISSISFGAYVLARLRPLVTSRWRRQPA
jgi:zinc/manganese transport system permease protein